ncbi:hypothetical protein B0H10DRAFT_2088078 [Mycena sp. CBHHK59/15]|nr:hypothetical protein B0H10DRAFT_2088078 [Mycena sp. CBHHK59/15]
MPGIVGTDAEAATGEGGEKVAKQGQESYGVVTDYLEGTYIQRRIAFTSDMFNPSPSKEGTWSYERILSDASFMAAGRIIFPPRSCKSTKATRDNTFVHKFSTLSPDA